MTAEEILTALTLALRDPLQERGAELHVCGVIEDAVSLLGLSPTRARVVLLMDSERVPDTTDAQVAGLVDGTLRVLVQVPRDWQLVRGAQWFQETGNRQASVLALATEVRCLLMRCRSIGEDAREDFDNTFGFRYLSRGALADPAGQGLRTIEMFFAITYGLSMPTGDPINLPFTANPD